jgi:hypothetical protein
VLPLKILEDGHPGVDVTQDLKGFWSSTDTRVCKGASSNGIICGPQ